MLSFTHNSFHPPLHHISEAGAFVWNQASQKTSPPYCCYVFLCTTSDITKKNDLIPCNTDNNISDEFYGFTCTTQPRKINTTTKVTVCAL